MLQTHSLTLPGWERQLINWEYATTCEKCWEAIKAVNEAKDVNEAHTKVVGGIIHTGSITAAFERKGKGKVTYSHKQHTKTGTKCKN